MVIDQIGTDWVPLMAALAGAAVALIGVFVGLVINGRRAKRQSRVEREDAVRADARRCVAELLSAAKSFHRHGRFMSDSSQWSISGHDQALVWAHEADEAWELMQQKLVAARLIIIEPRLVSDLDHILSTAENASETIHESVNSFSKQRAPGPVMGESDARWDAYEDAVAKLQDHAVQDLRPTVREKGRRWR